MERVNCVRTDLPLGNVDNRELRSLLQRPMSEIGRSCLPRVVEETGGRIWIGNSDGYIYTTALIL